jgi:hypothetical protein
MMDSYWDGYEEDKEELRRQHSKPLCTLKNWAVRRGETNPYMAPEAIATLLEGEVYHHPKLKDGEQITTSPVINSLDNIVETANSFYELKEPCVTYQAWCESEGITIDPDNPIKLK